MLGSHKQHLAKVPKTYLLPAVLEIDTMGTFNSSKAMYEECFKVSSLASL